MNSYTTMLFDPGVTAPLSQDTLIDYCVTVAAVVSSMRPPGSQVQSNMDVAQGHLEAILSHFEAMLSRAIPILSHVGAI